VALRYRRRCPVTTRPARRRKHASEAERRRDSAEGAELGPLSQREHLGGLAKSRLHGVLEDALTRLNGAPVDRTALPLGPHPATARAHDATRLQPGVIEKRSNAPLDQGAQHRPQAHRRAAIAVARVAFAKLTKQRVLARSLPLGKRRAGGLDDILRARIPHIEREAVGMQQRAHVGVQLGQDARPQRAGAGDQQSVIGRDPEQIVQRPRDMAKMRLGIFDLRALVARLRPAPCLWRPWTGSPKETASVSRCADPRRMRAKRSSTSATHTRPADAGSVSGAMNGASDMTNPARTGWARRSNRSRPVDSDKNSATARAPCAHSCAPPKISRARASAARRSWRSPCGRSPDSISRCAPPSSESISVARAGAVANYAGSRSR